MINSDSIIEINKYLDLLGVSGVGKKLFVSLAQSGPISITKLSKLSSIERTKIYRIIDDLVKTGILEEVVDYKKKLYKAADTHNILMLVEEQKQKTVQLENQFDKFSKSVSNILKPSTTQVQFYRGQDGIRQMLWNELSAKGESMVFIYKIFDEFVGSPFFDKWADEFASRNLSSREIRTELFDESYQDSPNDICFYITNIKMRYLKKKDFPIKHCLSIYNDVVSIYDFWEGEIFGVEIYNQRVADMQRIFFETFWKMAKPVSNEMLVVHTRRSHESAKEPKVY